MRILHAFSNWKWTGPAEPAVALAARLARHHQVTLACGHCPYDDLENRVLAEARARGLDVLTELRLRKHFDPLTGVRDLARLTRWIRDQRPAVIHTHLLNDHLLAGAAGRRSGVGPAIVRTVYGGRDLARRIRSALAFRRLTDGVVAASAAAMDVVRERTALPAERRFVVPGAVDVERFAADRLSPLRRQAREELGLKPMQVAAGIVARIQRHRRFELLLEAFGKACREQPELRLVIIGRGTHEDELVRQPVARLGLEGKVLLAGYREAERYEQVLAALDLGLFLVPGSDGSCRAARELVACGLPLLVTERPPLDEIVRDGETGHVLREDAEEFARALVRLAGDDERRQAMGRAARRLAEQEFSQERQAERILEIYRVIEELGPYRAGRGG